MTADSDPIVNRYSALARAALAGQHFDDRDADQARCFGQAAYSQDADAPDAALRASLGCGNPLAVASLAPGEFVLDLGSGGGLDVLLSARRVAPGGIAYGLDASADMLTLARAHADQAGVTNARFLAGRIEDVPLPASHVDVVISNCVINLSADKPRVLAEAYRVLKPGGRLGISDVIRDEHASPGELAVAEQLVGCVAGALTEREYRHHLETAGFASISISPARQAGAGLYSTIVQAVKPLCGRLG